MCQKGPNTRMASKFLTFDFIVLFLSYYREDFQSRSVNEWERC